MDADRDGERFAAELRVSEDTREQDRETFQQWLWVLFDSYYGEVDINVTEADQDSEKALNDVYEDRNLLACALAVATGAPSGWKPAPDTNDGWAIVWIETPMGQISWHVPREMAIEIGPERRAADYDGYDRDEKNDRLAEWAAEGAWY